MTQYERMTAGLIYDPADPEIVNEQSSYQEGLWEFNQLRPSEADKPAMARARQALDAILRDRLD